MEKSKFEKKMESAPTSIPDDVNEILTKVLTPYSVDMKMTTNDSLRVSVKLMEEMGELTQGLSKFLYKGNEVKWNVLEEMADVILGCKLFRIANGISEAEFNKALNVKLDKFKEKLIPKIEKEMDAKENSKSEIDAVVEEYLETAVKNKLDQVLDQATESMKRVTVEFTNKVEGLDEKIKQVLLDEYKNK